MLVSALISRATTVLHPIHAKSLGDLLGWGRRRSRDARLPRNAVAVLLKSLPLKVIYDGFVEKLITPLLATFQCAFIDLNVMVDDLALLYLPVKQRFKHTVVWRCGNPRQDRIPVPNKGSEVLVDHDAVHQIFHVIHGTMECVGRKVIVQTKHQLSASHHPSGVSFGFFVCVRLPCEIPFEDVGQSGHDLGIKSAKPFRVAKLGLCHVFL